MHVVTNLKVANYIIQPQCCGTKEKTRLPIWLQQFYCWVLNPWIQVKYNSQVSCTVIHLCLLFSILYNERLLTLGSSHSGQMESLMMGEWSVVSFIDSETECLWSMDGNSHCIEYRRGIPTRYIWVNHIERKSVGWKYMYHFWQSGKSSVPEAVATSNQ